MRLGAAATVLITSLCALGTVGWASTPASESAISAERRAAIAERLAILLRDESSAVPKSRSGVPIKKLSQILGTSAAFATMVLQRTDRHLNFEQGSKIAADSGVPVDHVLAADLLRRFASTADLAAAIEGDRVPVQDLTMHLFARQVELQYGTPAARPRHSEPVDVLTRWRAAVRRRLSTHLPGQYSSISDPTVHWPKLARSLGISTSVADEKIRGRKFLTTEEVRILADEFGVDADWIIAGDILDELASADEVHAASFDQISALRTMLFHRYADRVLSCSRDLGAEAQPGELK